MGATAGQDGRGGNTDDGRRGAVVGTEDVIYENAPSGGLGGERGSVDSPGDACLNGCMCCGAICCMQILGGEFGWRFV